MIRVCALSDLHGYEPVLPDGDLLIIAGDLTASNTFQQYADFFEWLKNQKYEKKIIVPGNHDTRLESFLENIQLDDDVEVLINSGTTFRGLKLWGCPHSLKFKAVNPLCAAYMLSEKELEKVYKKTPEHVDIYISHGPAYGILDRNAYGNSCGSKELKNLMTRLKPVVFICGHIHESCGEELYVTRPITETHFFTIVRNVAYVDENYRKRGLSTNNLFLINPEYTSLVNKEEFFSKSDQKGFVEVNELSFETKLAFVATADD